MTGAALTPDDKARMTAREVVARCPHAPEDANPCPCGIEWRNDGDGGWFIANRWATPWDGADQ